MHTYTYTFTSYMYEVYDNSLIVKQRNVAWIDSTPQWLRMCMICHMHKLLINTVWQYHCNRFIFWLTKSQCLNNTGLTSVHVHVNTCTCTCISKILIHVNYTLYVHCIIGLRRLID